MMRISSSTPLCHGRRCGAFTAKKDREFILQTARDAPVALVFEVLRFSVLTTSFALFQLFGIACAWRLVTQHLGTSGTAAPVSQSDANSLNLVLVQTLHAVPFRWEGKTTQTAWPLESARFTQLLLVFKFGRSQRVFHPRFRQSVGAFAARRSFQTKAALQNLQ